METLAAEEETQLMEFLRSADSTTDSVFFFVFLFLFVIYIYIFQRPPSNYSVQHKHRNIPPNGMHGSSVTIVPLRTEIRIHFQLRSRCCEIERENPALEEERVLSNGQMRHRYGGAHSLQTRPF